MSKVVTGWVFRGGGREAVALPGAVAGGLRPQQWTKGPPCDVGSGGHVGGGGGTLRWAQGEDTAWRKPETSGEPFCVSQIPAQRPSLSSVALRIRAC